MVNFSLEKSNVVSGESLAEVRARRIFDKIIELVKIGEIKEEEIQNLELLEVLFGSKKVKNREEGELRNEVNNEIIKLLKVGGIIKPPAKIEKPKLEVKEPELYKTEIEKKEGLKVVEVDDETKKVTQVNLAVYDKLKEIREIFNNTKFNEFKRVKEDNSYYHDFEIFGGIYSKENIDEDVQKLIDKESLYDNLLKEIDDLKIKILEMEGGSKVEKDILAIKNSKNELAKKIREYEYGKVSKEMSEFSEEIIENIVKEYHWYGKDVKFHAPSRFDDSFNGVDAVLEAEKDYYLPLGVDITIGVSENQDKVYRVIKYQINKDNLQKIKYVKIDDKPIKLFKAPKIILYIDSEDLKDLAYAYVNSDKEKLANNKIKDSVFDQMIVESMFFRDTAKGYGSNNSMKAYEKVYELFSKVADNDENLKKRFNILTDPLSYKANSIYKNLENIKLKFEMDEQNKTKQNQSKAA